MGLSALKGLEGLRKKPKKPEKPKQSTQETPQLRVKATHIPESAFHDNKADDGTQIVRQPRVTPQKMKHAVNTVSTGLAMTDPLGSKRETQERREQVVQWMLNGHTHEGKLCSVTELAATLQVPMETVEKDLVAIKGTFEKFYQENNVRDVTALAYMLMEMKLQDRGRALTLYNLIHEDIMAQDDNAFEFKDPKTGKMKKLGALTGRDRASMYGAMLSSLDLANRATNGIDNLIKLSGGFQKLQQVIHAKTVQINQGNGTQVAMSDLQEFARETLSVVLPSNRKIKNIRDTPAIIDLTDEDREIMAIGERERGDE